MRIHTFWCHIISWLLQLLASFQILFSPCCRVLCSLRKILSNLEVWNRVHLHWWKLSCLSEVDMSAQYKLTALHSQCSCYWVLLFWQKISMFTPLLQIILLTKPWISILIILALISRFVKSEADYFTRFCYCYTRF